MLQFDLTFYVLTLTFYFFQTCDRIEMVVESQTKCVPVLISGSKVDNVEDLANGNDEGGGDHSSGGEEIENVHRLICIYGD